MKAKHEMIREKVFFVNAVNHEAEWASFIKQQMESGTRFAHALTKL